MELTNTDSSHSHLVNEFPSQADPQNLWIFAGFENTSHFFSCHTVHVSNFWTVLVVVAERYYVPTQYCTCKYALHITGSTDSCTE